MAESTVRVRGLRELRRDFRKLDKGLAKEVRGELKQAGEIVRVEARSRFTAIDKGSAEGYKTRVRVGAVAVEQSRRRTTGKRPDYGRLQMGRALIPALDDKADEVVKSLDLMLYRLGSENGF